MIRLLLSAAMVPILVGCGENVTARGSPDSPSPNIKENPSPVAANAVSQQAQSFQDPEARNGLVKEVLAGRAFAVRDFGTPPEGDAEQVVRNLEDSARGGSGQASYAIHLKLWHCHHVLKPTRLKTPVDPGQWEECKGLSPERLEESIDWLGLAAEQGHLGAQIRFASDAEAVLGGMTGIFKDPDAAKEYKRKSMEYLHAAARRGSTDAMSRIGDDYLHGVRVERDPVLSYAYYLALQRAHSRSTSTLNMKYLEKELSVNQIEQAKRKSKEIYDECCSG